MPLGSGWRFSMNGGEVGGGHGEALDMGFYECLGGGRRPLCGNSGDLEFLPVYSGI